MAQFHIQYGSSECRLFIDSSKRSLKAVLLHNGGRYAFIPVAHSVYLKETYENLELVLKKVGYQNQNWFICGNLKVLCMLLVQQAGYTKYLCFLCLWDSIDRQNHWKQKNWPPRSLVVGEKNVLRDTLVPPEKVLLPPFHIKLGLMKQFVKALPKDSECLKYLGSRFPGLKETKLKEGFFVGPDIRKLISNKDFISSMTPTQKEAWVAFTVVIKNCLGDQKDPNYKEMVETMLKAFHKLGCSMSLKVNFLNSHTWTIFLKIWEQ